MLWGVSEATGRISALPASPLLLPAILTLGAVKIASWLYRQKPKTEPLPANFDWKEYEENKEEWDRLTAKIDAGIELTTMEWIKYNTVLPYPSWSNGERWRY